MSAGDSGFTFCLFLLLSHLHLWYSWILTRPHPVAHRHFGQNLRASKLEEESLKRANPSRHHGWDVSGRPSPVTTIIVRVGASPVHSWSTVYNAKTVHFRTEKVTLRSERSHIKVCGHLYRCLTRGLLLLADQIGFLSFLLILPSTSRMPSCMKSSPYGSPVVGLVLVSRRVYTRL